MLLQSNYFWCFVGFLTTGPSLPQWMEGFIMWPKSTTLVTRGDGSDRCICATILQGVRTNRNYGPNYKIAPWLVKRHYIPLKLGHFKLCQPCEGLLIPWTCNACQSDRKVNVSVTLEGLKTILPLVYLAYLHLVYYTTVHWYLPCPGLRPAGQ